MNFPNNSMAYDLYKLYPNPIDFLSKEEVLNFKQQISIAIINILSKSKIEDENILSLCIHLQLSIIKSAFPNSKEARIQFYLLLIDLYTSLKINNRKAIEYHAAILSIKNKELLIEIFCDVWHSPNSLIWLDKWKSYCKKSITSGVTFQKLFIRLSSIIYEHMDINSNDYFLLSSNLLHNILKASHNTNNS